MNAFLQHSLAGISVHLHQGWSSVMCAFIPGYIFMLVLMDARISLLSLEALSG